MLSVMRAHMADLSDVRGLQDRPGRLGITGSISIAQQLVDADLGDEYRLLIYPVLVGDGPGVFAGGERRDLDLVDATSFRSKSRSGPKVGLSPSLWVLSFR